MAPTTINFKVSITDQIHEEEVRYNEAFRMKAGYDVLRSIEQKIKHLKGLLREQTTQTIDGCFISRANCQ